jgi:DNA-binding winged helix-turn-helix (wHTH) protein/predicted ATPase
MRAMPRARYFVFQPFCLDVADERLWKEDANVPLGYKAFSVLAHLVARPDQLVTKDDLLASAWPGISVTEGVLTTAMREIRAAIGDTARTRRFIQTVHGRGYRFIADVVEASDRPSVRSGAADAVAVLTAAPDRPSPPEHAGIVGRQAEWQRLGEWYDAVRNGTRRIGFVAGEAGMGKSALVDAFVTRIASADDVRVGRGQCVEQYGGGEAYLPILEALGRLARDVGEPVVSVLHTYAPSWLAHLPSLPSSVARSSASVRPERMLRELAEALEALAATAPLVLVLEDLHWSDGATLRWLGYMARRRDPTRLLVLATYRPVEALLHATVLRAVLAELRHQPQSAEVVLDYLPADAVLAYLHLRRVGSSAPDDLANLLYRRTGGHPLFVASLVDAMLQVSPADGTHQPGIDLHATAKTIPLNVRQFIEHRFEQLTDDDRAVLESASVAGDPFPVAAVAAGTSLSQEQIEARCARLARDHRILDADGIASWPDGTVCARYRFRHAVFHETAYSRISPERRVRLHHLIGTRLEAAHAAMAPSIAAELAMHFEHGRDFAKASSWLEQAARNAIYRSAYTEAHDHLVRIQRILERLPADAERLRREAALSLLLAQVLEMTKGWGAADVAREYSRARALAVALDDEPRLLQATWGLVAGSIVRAELSETRLLARQILRLARKRRDGLFRMAAHTELGGTAFAVGETLAARRHFRAAEALYDPAQHDAGVAAFGTDLGIFGRIWATHLMWHQGFPDEARARAGECVRTAADLGHPFTRTIVLAYAAMLSQFLRDTSELDRLADATIEQASEHGFPYYLAWGEVLRGWSRAAQGAGASAVGEIRAGIAVLRTTARLRLPYYCSLLAEACGLSGRANDGLEVLAQAFDDVRETGERWWDAELHRMRGDLLLATGRSGDAEQSFRTAIDIARGQRARSLELRAAASLERLSQGVRHAGR